MLVASRGFAMGFLQYSHWILSSSPIQTARSSTGIFPSLWLLGWSSVIWSLELMLFATSIIMIMVMSSRGLSLSFSPAILSLSVCFLISSILYLWGGVCRLSRDRPHTFCLSSWQECRAGWLPGWGQHPSSTLYILPALQRACSPWVLLLPGCWCCLHSCRSGWQRLWWWLWRPFAPGVFLSPAQWVLWQEDWVWTAAARCSGGEEWLFLQLWNPGAAPPLDFLECTTSFSPIYSTFCGVNVSAKNLATSSQLVFLNRWMCLLTS